MRLEDLKNTAMTINSSDQQPAENSQMPSDAAVVSEPAMAFLGGVNGFLPLLR